LSDFLGEAALAAYRGVGRALAPALPLLLRRRAAQGKVDRPRVAERTGKASLPRPAGRVAWVHAASVGETLAVVPLLARLVGDGLAVVLTTGTLTSAEIAGRRLPAGAVHQFAPLDVAPFVGRFLDHWRPQVAIFVESEIWPATIGELKRRSVPLAIVNARFSERAFRRWRRLGAVAAPLFARIALVLAQSGADAARFAAAGAPRVVVTGNLKWDAPPLAADPAALATLRAAIDGRPTWLAASTHPGEEEIVATAHKLVAARHPRLLTVIVPRHPNRGDEAAATVAAAGLAVARRSRGEGIDEAIAVYLADTLGELGLFYRLAPVAFVGNSLVAGGGGHNPIEAIQLGATVLHGPHVANFAEVFACLDAAVPQPGVDDAASLAVAVLARLADPAAARDEAARAARALAPMSGALDRTLAALKPWLAGGPGS
jgi:3-deoxy-D-manno-octulosonic-acid transferase